MILNREDALHAANIFIDYFQNFDRIDDYLRKVKLERMSNYPTSLPGMGPQDDMFSDFTMHPNDMEFECREVTPEIFVNYLEITTSHAVEASSVGKSIRWVIYEKNTGKIAGFIKLGSPTINSRPRNEFLGKPLNTSDDKVMKRFNDSCIMGFIIVPTQPFGFNYLGGKLLALLASSNELKRRFDQKYGTDLHYFETTSLYGTTKGVSMYDGLKPFIRHIGDTESKFLPLFHDDYFRKMFWWFNNNANGGERLISADKSSKKLKIQTKMISIIIKSLQDASKLHEFKQCIEHAKTLTEKKRYYISEFGYEPDQVIEWWKKKATKRYEKLKSEDRLRYELELWKPGKDLEIIR